MKATALQVKLQARMQAQRLWYVNKNAKPLPPADLGAQHTQLWNEEFYHTVARLSQLQELVRRIGLYGTFI